MNSITELCFVFVVFCATASKFGNGLDFANHPNRHLLPPATKCGQRIRVGMPKKNKTENYNTEDYGTYDVVTDDYGTYDLGDDDDGAAARIWGGNVPSYNVRYPWMAVIYPQRAKIKRNYCGGSIINKRYVLTAGHCINPKRIRRLSVGFTRYDIWADYDDDTVYEAESYVHHPNFDRSKEWQGNDIALIRTNRDIKFTFNIKPICLPIEKKEVELELEGKLLEVIGFGRNDFYGTPQGHIIHNVRIPILPRNTCLQYKYFSPTDPNIMCAGGLIDGRIKRPCKGDSGGPYLKKIGPPGKKRIYQYGLVRSASRPTDETDPQKKCDNASPVIATRVVPYMQWILDTIEE